MELFLWLFFLLPGLLYSVWRLSQRKKDACPSCNREGMLSLHTPFGARIYQDRFGVPPDPEAVRLAAIKSHQPSPAGKLLLFGVIGLAVFVGLMMLATWVTSPPTYEPEDHRTGCATDDDCPTGRKCWEERCIYDRKAR